MSSDLDGIGFLSLAHIALAIECFFTLKNTSTANRATVFCCAALLAFSTGSFLITLQIGIFGPLISVSLGFGYLSCYFKDDKKTYSEFLTKYVILFAVVFALAFITGGASWLMLLPLFANGGFVITRIASLVAF